MTRGRMAQLMAPVKLALVVGATMVLVSACSGDQCLVEPGCGSSSPPPPPPPIAAVLEIASFSVVEYHIPGDYFCGGFCQTPVIDVVEKTSVGRAFIRSVTVLGYKTLSTTPTSCPVQPGQHLRLNLLEEAWLVDSAVGQERTIVVTYDDGAGGAATLSGRTFVTASLPEGPFDNLSSCRLGRPVSVEMLAPSLRSTSR